MPRKDFLDGDALPASDLNTYLMDQAVQTYGSVSARDTALPTPTDGQVTTEAGNKNLQTYYDRWRPLPFAMYNEREVITGTGTAVASIATTFAAGRFTVAPNIFTNCSTNNLVFSTATGVSATGATISIRLITGATFSSTHTVHYVAFQMSNTTALG
jgi:hypothetical protein